MCHQIVEEVWSANSNWSLFEKINECSNILSVWGQEITGIFKNRIQECKIILKMVKGRRDNHSVSVMKHEQKKLAEVYAQQEVFWKQRSKQMWLREGDNNSKFFHASVRKRRAANQISSLKNSEGDLVGWNSGLEEVVTNYFAKLFTTA